MLIGLDEHSNVDRHRHISRRTTNEVAARLHSRLEGSLHDIPGYAQEGADVRAYRPEEQAEDRHR